jgi:hypothetical protein
VKIPYPGDLNPIETAVWAAEYVRYLAACSTRHSRGPDDIAAAVEAANETIDDLRRARELS